MIRFSKGFDKDNTCDANPVHRGICSVCLFGIGGGGGSGGGGGGCTLPGEHVMLLSRPQTPPQSTEKMKADTSLPPFLSRLLLLFIERFLLACRAPTYTRAQIESHVKFIQKVKNATVCIKWKPVLRPRLNPVEALWDIKPDLAETLALSHCLAFGLSQ